MGRVIAAALIAAGLSSQAPPALAGERSSKTVVFVCEHGTVKSVIAMLWFNKRAKERGMDVRAVSRGVVPDPAVPKAIADNLRKDGLELAAFTPAGFTKDDLDQAVRVVAIGVDTSHVTRDGGVAVEAWGDIPPATQDYAAARDAMRARIERLLTESSLTDPPK